MKTFIADKKIKLSRFLLAEFDGGLSFTALNKLFRKKDIKVNGTRVGKDTTVFAGDKVEVYYDGERPAARYEVLFEDDNVLIVVKPKGITSENFYGELIGRVSPLYFCHRLDRNTDGIMIFAKTERAFDEIKKAFKARAFEKYYHAVVYGKTEKDCDELCAYLKKDCASGLVRIYYEPTEGALPIKTGYKALYYNAEKNVTLAEVRLFTGRTHQIRAHLASVGHFVIGDGKYGIEKINRELKAKTLMLTSVKTVLHFGENETLFYLDGRSFEYESRELTAFAFGK